jgi:hypothetical protein
MSMAGPTPRPTTVEQAAPSPDIARPLVAVILDAARPYDRLIIGGIAQYVREHAPWSLYVEEDPLQKLPDLARWHGQGIIANFDDRRVAKAIRGLSIPVVGVGGGYGWYDPDSSIPYIYTDNEAIGRLGAEHLLACGFERLAFYGYPRTATSGPARSRPPVGQRAGRTRSSPDDMPRLAAGATCNASSATGSVVSPSPSASWPATTFGLVTSSRPAARLASRFPVM